MAKMHNPKIWDLFDKGTEHDEIRDLFIEFVEKLDERVLDKRSKEDMLLRLKEASNLAHRGIAVAYPTIKDLNPLPDLQDQVNQTAYVKDLPNPLPKRVPGFIWDKPQKPTVSDPNEEVSEFDAKDINYKDYRTANPFLPEVTVTKASAYEAPETRIEIQKD